MKKIFFILLILLSSENAFCFGKNKVVYTPYEWKIIETKNLKIYVPSTILFLSNKIASIGDEIYIRHSTTYDYKPPIKIKILIFPDFNAFLQNNILDMTSSQVKGFTEFLKGRVVIYYSPDYNEFYHLFAHELNHAFQVYFWGKGEANIYSMRNLDVPLWFIEGGSEFNSIGLDAECENIISEALYNGNLPSIMELSDLSSLSPAKYFYIYKEGQIFYYFLSNNYGNETIQKITKDIVESRNFEKSLKKFTGKELKEINEEFFHFLRGRYYTNYINLSVIDLKGYKLIKSDKKYAISPVDVDGTNFLLITENRFTPSLVLYDKQKNKTKRLISTYRSEEFFEFLYDDDNHIGLSRNKEAVFITRGSGKNQLYIYNLNKMKAQKIDLPFSIVKSPDISKDGTKIVFSAIDNNQQSDIYLYEIQTKKLINLTEDKYVDNEPRFLDDDNIVFTSDRMNNINIYFLSINDKKVDKYLSINKDIRNPSVKDDRLVFISKEAFPSLFIFDLKKQILYRELTPIGKIETPSISTDGKIFFAIYKGGKHEVYEYNPSLTNIENSFKFEKFTNAVEEKEYEANNIKIKDYSIDISMDYLVGGIAINSMLGLGAVGITSLSDVLGNHRYSLWLDSGLFFQNNYVNNINVDFAYSYLKYRYNIGFRIFHYSNYFYEFYTFRNFFEIEKSYFKTYGVYGLYSYPFNTFNRIDLRVGIRNFDYIKNFSYNPETKTYSYDLDSKLKNTITLDFVHDTTLSDYTGPVDGIRMLLSIEQSLDLLGNGLSYTKMIADLRNYFLIFPGYSIATRFTAGKIIGRDEMDYNFYLGGFNSLRGYDLFAFSGNTMFLINLEFRFPLLTYWQIGFPIPLRMPTIWGSIFYDCGSAFNWGRDFTAYEVKDGIFHFKDLKNSFGIGLRLILTENIKLFYDLAAPYDGTGFPDSRKWNSFWFIGIDF
ncbi:MAG: BamA/TamA family outer membrane protein [Brevinematales bacterium]|nr:BamA/TamA family outer membrane protein [Brevinematales bacterium]